MEYVPTAKLWETVIYRAEHVELLTLLWFKLFSLGNLWSIITFIQFPIGRFRAT